MLLINYYQRIQENEGTFKWSPRSPMSRLSLPVSSTSSSSSALPINSLQQKLSAQLSPPRSPPLPSHSALTAGQQHHGHGDGHDEHGDPQDAQQPLEQGLQEKRGEGRRAGPCPHRRPPSPHARAWRSAAAVRLLAGLRAGRGLELREPGRMRSGCWS